MATCDVNILKAQACVSGFGCVDDQIARALKLQMLCDIAGGTPTCINLIPDGSTYSFIAHQYTLSGLTIGSSYSFFFGSNDNNFDNKGDVVTDPGGNHTVTFVALALFITLNSNPTAGTPPVTAIVCAL